jgi:hypothetical protein
VSESPHESSAYDCADCLTAALARTAVALLALEAERVRGLEAELAETRATRDELARSLDAQGDFIRAERALHDAQVRVLDERVRAADDLANEIEAHGPYRFSEIGRAVARYRALAPASGATGEEAT